MSLHPHEICLIASVVFLLLIFVVYYYFEFLAEHPKVYEKLAIGSYHTSWCRDLD